MSITDHSKACSFYGLTPILIPFGQEHNVACKLLQQTQAQCVVATAGSLPLAGLTESVSSLRQVIWVTDSANKHMDWEGAQENETRGKLDVSVWHNLVAEASSANNELPKNDENIVPGNLIFLWQKNTNGPAEVVEFTQKVREGPNSCDSACSHDTEYGCSDCRSDICLAPSPASGPFRSCVAGGFVQPFLCLVSDHGCALQSQFYCSQLCGWRWC